VPIEDLKAANLAAIKHAESQLNAGNIIKWHTQQQEAISKSKGRYGGVLYKLNKVIASREAGRHISWGVCGPAACPAPP
jgi:hypothetical protein